MPLSIHVLASGSRSNAICLSADNHRILIDAGLGVRSMMPALQFVGIRPEDLTAILITHEHADHVRGLGSLLARTKAKVCTSPGTFAAIDYMIPSRIPQLGLREKTVEIGPFTVRPIAVPHDAAEPLAYHISVGSHRVTVATDLGEVPLALQTVLAHSTVAIFESNHDEEMLRNGSYPQILKDRIASPTGHLSNLQSSAALSHARGNGLRAVVLAHISDENNDPALARASARDCLDDHVEVHVTNRLQAGPFLELE